MMHKTERILKQQLSCLGCHQFGDEGGHLAPDLLQVKDRLSPDYVREFIVKPSAKIPGTRMPGSRMTPARLETLVSYLFQHQRPPGQPRQLQVTGMDAPTAADTGEGPSLFRHYCAACHGTSGLGDGPNASSLEPPPTNLASAELMRRRPDDTLFDIIAVGGRVFDINPRMPAWGESLSPGQIRSLVNYIRELCQCRGPDWSRDSG